MKKNQPNADTIGKELETKRLVAFDGRKYNQTAANCFEIACYLADKFSYQHPLTLGGLKDRIRHNKSVQLGWDSPSPYENLSEACFVIRTPQETVSALGLSDPVHVVFELFGKEYNYGTSTKHGFPIERRLYLQKSKEHYHD